MLIDKDIIQEAKQKLGIENAFIMAKELELEEFDEKNLRSICPFHSEKSPSFIYNPKTYTFHCFGACSRSYDIIDVFMLKGLTYLESVQKLFKESDTKYSFGELKVKTKHQYKYPKEVICNNKDKVYDYLGMRKISKTTVDYADIRQDEHDNVVFNFYDSNDVLTLVKYRPSRKIEKGEIKTWCQKDADTSPILFNMNRININSPLLICEGEIDSLSAIESGYLNAVSVPLGAGNFGWMEENWDWLQQFEQIIVCSDNDDAGLKMQKELIFRLGSWRTKVVEIPQYFEKEDGSKIPVNDLNEVLFRFGKEKVLEIIVNAKDTPVDSVVDFSDIEDVDLDDIDGIQTGIKAIDKELFKLFNGTFNVLTGINGSGKTSLLSQLVCQALEQDKNTFFYSGELPNHQTKNWINFILSGQRHLNEYKTDETVFWKVQPDVKKQMNEYYKGRLFVYKDGYSRKVDDILKSMEDNVRKYGVKLCLIDNLTAVNLGNNDNNKYEKQTDFIVSLIDFAKKFNIVVILVVHPHKMDTTRRMTKMDIQGVMALSDLAHRVLSLYRVSAKDKQGVPNKKGDGWYVEPIKHDVLFDILKDRMRGSEGNGIGLYYDKPSRRFFTDATDLDIRYKWDTGKYTTPLPFKPPQFDDKTNLIYGEIKGSEKK